MAIVDVPPSGVLHGLMLCPDDSSRGLSGRAQSKGSLLWDHHPPWLRYREVQKEIDDCMTVFDRGFVQRRRYLAAGRQPAHLVMGAPSISTSRSEG